MEDILQANIFFFITAIGVIVLTTLGCILLYQLIKIVRAIRRIVDRVDAGSEVIIEDIEHIRENLNPANLISYIMRFVPGAAPPRRRRRKNDDG